MSSYSLVTAALAALSAAYSLVYGIRYAHRLYSLANVWSLWLALGTSEAFLSLRTHAAAGAAARPPPKQRTSPDELGSGTGGRKVARTVGDAGAGSRG
ncbi:hypothetical protein JCM1841_004540 [Sporobolomyces salmonicolor]